MSEQTFDLIVIGGGPGGYVAAIRAAQLGMTVACVEKRASLGGTCLNVGCIPSKALLQSSHHYAMAAEGLTVHGVNTGKVSLDLAAMMKRKDAVVAENVKGVDFLFKKNKITRVLGAASLKDSSTVVVDPGKGAKKQTLTAENILIATGSESTPLPGIEIDEKRVVTSTGALALSSVPKTLIVIGAGIIGLELGSVWSRLGAEVTVVEFVDRILPGLDGEVAAQTARILKRQGLDIRLSTKVTGAKATAKGVTLNAEPVKGGAAETYKADVVLVAVGRRPYTEGLGLEKIGVTTDKRGFVTVDGDFQTSVPGVFAIGDVIGGLMLAHKAEDEGVAVAEILAGQKGHVNYAAIPGVVYTWPEVAGVGRTEEVLKEEGIAYKVGKFPFAANSRARCNADTEGFVKVLADAKTDAILGVHIVGPEAGDLIQEAVIAMEFGGSAEDLARSAHGHPGLAEALKEAALAVAGRAIHI
ncbi:MAG: dihydrolipoyl dehydrogenase [Rhodospirillales bacterium]|nr:dihydrolipoyl dehydrogenase [Rhodospirillales bacterium]